MSLDKCEKRVYLELFKERFERVGCVHESLVDLYGIAPESKVSVALYEFVQPYIQLMSELFDDKDQWIEWFVWENDLGKRGLEAGAASWDECRPIKTIDDLLLLLEG